ncbi:peptidase M28D family protein [Planoprotostelium fungivorum]|uniref:Carboxypeptidase Q n=1 Tax=Planoprotostelium fungivorum TaxID=1890364 RepID=A0A2P6NWA5_9EUKA|nr:peptidase M28D family protein [Planoprotostelium fungivorum]
MDTAKGCSIVEGATMFSKRSLIPQTQTFYDDERPRNRAYILSALGFLLVLALTIKLAFVLNAREGDISGELLNTNAYVANCRTGANQLIQSATSGSDALWNKLADFTDTIGPRLSGSVGLENGIDWVEARMKQDGLENVHREPVQIPAWRRGNEWAILTTPLRNKTLSILGLGLSVGTGGAAISGDVFVVSSFDELESNCSRANGKVVVFNAEWISYGTTVAYRSRGAAAAAKCGGIAALVRSVTPYSLYTPHTGMMSYRDGVKKIPTASVTVEDALMMSRMQSRGTPMSVQLYMEANGDSIPEVTSYNVMGEITGSQYPNEVIVMGGHIDSWDVGEGAMDDGGGLFVSWEAVRLMKVLNLRPKRTVRVVAFVNEEDGARGGQAYRDAHVNETTIIAIESDIGITSPKGLNVTGTDETMNILSKIGQLLTSIDTDTILPGDGGTDVDYLSKDGANIAGLNVDYSKYFYWHHTNADTMDKLDPKDLGKSAATMAVYSYCIADLDKALPRNPKDISML